MTRSPARPTPTALGPISLGPISLGPVLIANRGEIAVRVARACRELGVPSIVVYTDQDRDAPHLGAGDRAVPIGNYLDIDAVVAVARASGAAAVHPGYGFLSERAEFAAAVVAAGLVFVGPTASVMQQLGRKDTAREVAVAAGVPVVPQLAQDRLAAGDFPVLVKAAAGGGGKGMRIVRTPAELEDALVAARREAAGAFGDDAVLVEKYVEHGRHVEVQVLGDTHGNVVHLFERDCSTQRRHQKVLEEAPGPTVTPDLRRALTDAAVQLARQVGYSGAGTVEFLLDPATGAFYFLEMNTRLQVEHPVTELVTGLDLVQLQLRIAAGEPLPFVQDDLVLHGHAIEARVYAEDAYHGFLPQAGTASLVRWPARARVDAALEDGQVVSTAYDPMLGKVITHAPDRESARQALVAALDDTAVLGLTTNIGFLRDVAASDAFRDAVIDTSWLDTVWRTTPAAAGPDRGLARLFAAWAQARAEADSCPAGDPFRADGFRLGAAPAPHLVELDRSVLVDLAEATVDGRPVLPLPADGPLVRLGLGADQGAGVEQAVVQVRRHEVEVALHGHRHLFHRPDAFVDAGAPVGDGTVVAPMPGTVIDVRATPGQAVAAGDVLGTLEAMKMELTLRAPFPGEVLAVYAEAGQQVALGTRLFLVVPADASQP